MAGQSGVGISRDNGPWLGDLTGGIHSNALPESKTVARVDAEEARREHYLKGSEYVVPGPGHTAAS